MIATFILTDYANQAMSYAEFDKLEDGTFAGKIPECPGAISFATTLRECEETLHSVLEDWVFVGLKLDQVLPIIDGIDLNRELLVDL